MQTSIPGSKRSGGDPPSHPGVSNISSTRPNRSLITSVSSMRILCGGVLRVPVRRRGSRARRCRAGPRHELHGPEAELGRAGGVGPHEVGHDAQQLGHEQLGAHAQADTQPHGLGVRNEVHEGPRHLEVRAVGRGQLAVVVGQGTLALAGQGVAQGGGGQPPGLVAVGDALAVERVDGAAGIARDHDVPAGTRPDRQAHGELPAGRRPEARLGPDAPRRRGEVHEGVHQVAGVEALPALVGREQADADVHPAVAHREDPAVAGDHVALGVADVEVGLNEGVVVAVRAVVAAQGHAHGEVPAPGRAQHAADPRVGTVGHHDVAGLDGPGGVEPFSLTVTPVRVGSGPDGGAPSSTTGAVTSVPCSRVAPAVAACPATRPSRSCRVMV